MNQPPAMIELTHQEVVEAILKHKGIRAGTWGLNIRFAITGINAGPNNQMLNPCGMVSIVSIGVAQTEQVSNLSVDAAQMGGIIVPKLVLAH